MAKLDDVLSNPLREIEAKLETEVRAVMNTARDVYIKGQSGLNKKKDRIEQIKEEQVSLANEKEQLTNEIEASDPRASGTEVSKATEKYGAVAIRNASRYRTTKSDIAIAKSVYKTKEVKNMKAFKKIKEQIKNQFNLAVTAKQKQQVIFNLQTTIDWKQLGINIPNMFEASKVEIVNGEIVIDNALPANIK